MMESLQTRFSTTGIGDAVSMVTELAALEERDVVYGRRNYEDCGFFQYDSGGGRPVFPPYTNSPTRTLETLTYLGF
jgi:hypothetical protein